MTLNSIDNLCGQSVIGTFNMIEYADIKTIDGSKWDYPPGARVDKLFTDDIFNIGSSWLKMPAVIKRKTLSGNTQVSEQGPYVEVDIRVFVPFFNNNITIEMAKMKHRRFIIKLTLEEGTFVIGAPDYPLDFKFNFATANTSSGTKGYECAWTGLIPNMARKM